MYKSERGFAPRGLLLEDSHPATHVAELNAPANGEIWHCSSCTVVSDDDFGEMLPWFPAATLSAMAAGDHSPLPQFGSHSLGIDGACDLGSVRSATDKKPNKYMRTEWKQGVMSSTVQQHTSHSPPRYPNPHPWVNSFLHQRGGKSVYQLTCQGVFRWSLKW